MDLARLWKKVGAFCSGRREAYVVGAYMAKRIEERLGKEALVATVAEGPGSFIRTYNGIAKPGMRLVYQPPPVPEESVYLELRKAALAGDDAAVEALLATVEAAMSEGTSDAIDVYEGYLLYVTGHLLLLRGRVDQGRLEQAIRAFRCLVAAKPELAAGHLGLGGCYQAAGQDDLARTAYAEGLRLNPHARWAAVALQELE
jgi:tetratricopeptide (TPR) repeat protein